MLTPSFLPPLSRNVIKDSYQDILSLPGPFPVDDAYRTLVVAFLVVLETTPLIVQDWLLTMAQHAAADV